MNRGVRATEIVMVSVFAYVERSILLRHMFIFFFLVVENDDGTAELYVECALHIDGAPFGLPTRTRLYHLVIVEILCCLYFTELLRQLYDFSFRDD